MSGSRLSILTLVLVLVLAPSARADGDIEALLAESIESTSGKSADTAKSAPALSLNVTAEDLHRYGIRTLAEAYNFLTMGLDSEDPLGDPEIGARGILFPADRGKHVLLLLNGHILNDQESGASFHGHGFGVPIEMIDHIEVVVGPGSVLYGGNAMFGVINVITKRAKDFAGVQLVAEAAFSPPLNRARNPIGPGGVSPYLSNLGHAYRLSAGAGYEFILAGVPAEITAALEYYTFVGPTMTWGPQTDQLVDFGPRGTLGVWGGKTTASYYERTPSGYVRFLAGEVEASLGVVVTRLSSPFVRINEMPLDPTFFDDPDAYRDRRKVALDLKWHHNVSDVTSVVARIYADTTAESGRLHQRNFYGCFSPFLPASYVLCELTNSGYAHSVGTELQARFDWNGDGAFVTMLGTDGRVRRVGYRNGVSAPATGQKAEFGRVDSTEEAGAVYAEQVYQPARWVTLNAGARWDFDSQFGNRISPRGAVITEAWRGGTVKAIYSEASRAPTADERSYRDPQLVLQSRNLKSESVRSVEAILEQRFGAQSLIFGVFRSSWRNMIVRHDLRSNGVPEDAALVSEAQRAGLLSSNVGDVLQYRNLGSVENLGFNGGHEGSSMAGRLAYGFSWTAAYTRSNAASGPVPLAVTPSWFGNARLSYDLTDGLPIVALAAHFSGKRLADVGQDASLARPLFAPPNLDFKLAVNGPFPRLPHLSYRLLVDYSFAPTSPYTAGALIQGQMPELVPANRLTIMFGLQINL